MVGRFLRAYLHAGMTILVVTALSAVYRSRAVNANESLPLLQPWTLLLYALAAGALSMAIIEIVKRLTNIRGHFHQAEIVAFLAKRSGEHQEEGSSEKFDRLSMARQLEAVLGISTDPVAGEPTAVRRLVRFFDPAGLLAVFAAPLEQICGQIANGTDLMMADPNTFELLLKGLTGLSGVELTAAIQEPENRGVAGPVSPNRPITPLELSYRLRSGIDLMQIAVGRQWRWNVRLTALWMSGLTASLLFYGSQGIASSLLLVFAVAAAGGYFAWLWRDVAAVIERQRR